MPAVTPIRERDRHRHDGELERHRKLLQDQLHHRLFQPHRLAEVAGEHALDPVQVLDRDRLIEAVLAPDLLDHRRVALLARHDQRRIAGQELLQREDDHRHEEQRRQKLHEPAADEGEHPHLSPCGRGRVGEADRVRGETPMPVHPPPPCGGGRVGEAERVRGKTPMPGPLALRQPFEPKPRRHRMLNASRILEHLVIPEPQDDKVARAQPGVALAS